MPKCAPGDHLLFWIGRKGYIGYGVVTGQPRKPLTKADAPWIGGTERFTAVVPMVVQLETSTPLFLPFINNLQKDTGFNTAHLQRGMSKVSEEAATLITERLLTKYLEEDAG